MRANAVLSLLVVGFLTSGCSTLSALSQSRRNDLYGDSETPKDVAYVYCGTRLQGSWESAYWQVAESPFVLLYPVILPFLLADTTASFALDTLLLPVTIPLAVQYKEGPEPAPS